MDIGKKVLYGLLAIITLNFIGGLFMNFLGIDTASYSDYLTWISFVLIIWMFLPESNTFSFTSSTSDNTQ